MYIQTKFNQAIQGSKEQNLKLNTHAYETPKITTTLFLNLQNHFLTLFYSCPNFIDQPTTTKAIKIKQNQRQT